MKKALIALIIVVLVFAAIIGAAWFYLPTLAFRIAGKALGGSIEASRSEVTYRNGLIAFSFEGVKLTGKAEGRIGRCELDVLPSRGIYIKRLSASDFDIKVPKSKGRLAIFPVPVELAEIGKGFLEYEGRKYTVRELRITDFNTGRTTRFSIDVGIEGIGDVKTHGEGLFGETKSDIKGDYTLSHVNLAFLQYYEGFADSTGRFSYRNGKFVMDGEAKSDRMSIWEKFLLKRIAVENAHCRIRATWAGDVVGVTLTGLSFDGAPLTLDIKTRKKKLAYLALTLDYVRVPVLFSYLDFTALSDKGWDPFSYVKDGRVRAESFVFAEGEPLHARIHLKDASGGDGSIFVRDAEGILEVNGRALLLSDFSARFGDGSIRDVSGLIPLKAGEDLKIAGKYTLALKDLDRFNDKGQIEAKGGSAEGTLALQGKQGQGFKLATSGILRDGYFSWKGINLRASTDYRLVDNTVTFDRLLVSSDHTSLTLKGKARRDSVSVDVLGTLDGRHIARLYQPPGGYRFMKGSVDLDGHVEAGGGTFSTRGRVDLTRLAVEIPNVVRKASGVDSRASLVVHGGAGGEVFVEDLKCAVGEATARAQFDVGKGKISNAHIALEAPRMEKLAGLFFFDRTDLQGDLSADVFIRNVSYPVRKLPLMTGRIKLTDGAFRLPSMAKPLKHVNLSCRLDNDRFVLDSSGLQAGTSVLANGRLVLTGTEAPDFSLVVDMTRFDPFDFAAADGRSFRLPVIPEGALMSHARGTFSLKADRLDMGRLSGRDVRVTGGYADRTIALDQGNMKTGGGFVSLQGNARLADVPQINVTGELKDVTAQEVFSLMGANSDILDGTGSIRGTLRLTGRDGGELVRSASGTISVLSRDGAVQKWNLLSKLLAFTNVYELLRGRVDLTRSGLVYRKLSASFEGKDGCFRTNDFLIESPAMVIAGQGNVDAGKKTIDARMVVSPLVEMDRIIDWIPILRSIIKEKKHGLIFFMYDVKGPVSDPEIESRHVESMGRRAFNIIWNAIRLPKSLVDRLPEVVDGFPKRIFEK
jgi:hypothetical protein